MTGRTPSEKHKTSKKDELSEFNHREYLNKKFDKKPKITSEGQGTNKVFTYFFIGLIVLGFAIGSGVFRPSSTTIDASDTFDYDLSDAEIDNINEGTKINIVIYADETCSCCLIYVEYMNRNGFEVKFIKSRISLDQIKIDYSIPKDMQACHTTVLNWKFIEGHIPVTVVIDFIQNENEFDGISLPGMPQGSPGMDGDKNSDWVIYGLINGEMKGIFDTV